MWQQAGCQATRSRVCAARAVFLRFSRQYLAASDKFVAAVTKAEPCVLRAVEGRVRGSGLYPLQRRPVGERVADLVLVAWSEGHQGTSQGVALEPEVEPQASS